MKYEEFVKLPVGTLLEFGSTPYSLEIKISKYCIILVQGLCSPAEGEVGNKVRVMKNGGILRRLELSEEKNYWVEE